MAYAETSRSNEDLGWKAESSLDEAMQSAWIGKRKLEI